VHLCRACTMCVCAVANLCALCLCARALGTFPVFIKVRVSHACATTAMRLPYATPKAVHLLPAHARLYACFWICPSFTCTIKTCVCFINLSANVSLYAVFPGCWTAAVAFDTVLVIGVCCLQVLKGLCSQKIQLATLSLLTKPQKLRSLNGAIS